MPSSSNSRLRRRVSAAKDTKNKERITSKCKTKTRKAKRKRQKEKGESSPNKKSKPSSSRSRRKPSKIDVKLEPLEELFGFDSCENSAIGAIKTPKFSTPKSTPQYTPLSDDENSDVFELSTSIFKQRSFCNSEKRKTKGTPRRSTQRRERSFSFDPETIHKLSQQSRDSYDLSAQDEPKKLKKRKARKRKKTKRRSMNDLNMQQIELEIEQDQISKAEEIRFLEQQRREIDQMMSSMLEFSDDGESCGETECFDESISSKSISGREQITLNTEIRENEKNEWRVSVHERSLNREHKNNLSVGIQIVDKNGKTNECYSNEKGMIYKNKKMIKKGLRIKTKSEIIITAAYQANKEEVFVNFAYFKRGRLLRTDSKPIKIRNLKQCEGGMPAKIFIAQNGGSGTYSIVKEE